MTAPQEPIREAPDGRIRYDAGLDAAAGVDDLLGLSQLIANGVIDVVPGDPPVPITVWRVADDGDPYGQHHTDGLTGRTAQLLVGLYTRVGDTIVSLGHDPAVAGAAGAGGRRYLPVDTTHRLADLDHVSGTVQLIMLPWPPTAPERTGTTVSGPASSGPAMGIEAMVDLFTACRVLLATDGYSIVAVPPVTAANVHHLWQLVPAARTARLGWVEQIVAITADVDGDQLDVPAAPTDPATLRLADDLVLHIDLYVFVIRGGRHG
ncbi:hypothetical protein [Virgisporangium aurantiacum]|uniref:Uncharacterized protein n=1 Tax=Virgisporangium aurantiacum TaxID=175570 RepID=A0A8J3Z477_9ACTN|nr:hypothetical protein [Virgisporangium aurantiacum]GIJ54990.1 hypothetical protein Vau01_025060 [Virgisporangium aurantiacum]